MIDFLSIMEAIQRNPLYLVGLVFFAWYPIYSSALWVFTSIVFFARHERRAAALGHKITKAKPLPTESGAEPDEFTPRVTVLMSAYNEAEHIERTIKGCLDIDYPDYEIVIVNDGSKDDTLKKIKPHADAGRVRLINKPVNEGKAMALNDAIPLTNGEVILIIDADAVPDRNILRAIVPHFRASRVGAVTGNPRVKNRRSLLSKLQAIEFASIVSLQRRGARVWGKMLTMSGVVGAFHRHALYDAELFSPQMATEDIDLTWKLQLKHYDIRYEPRAIVWMRVPVSVRGLWRQRTRWARGLAQVLRRHGREAFKWHSRRLWPVLIESLLSIVWAYCFVIFTALWAVSYAVGYPPIGASPIPNYWGMLIGTMCLFQLLVGVLLDRLYDRRLPWYYVVAVVYPIIYWMLMAVVTFFSTPGGLMRSAKGAAPVRWKPVRETG
ncbi:MAG: poly-beta-1,6 N-acetyl-D-glucosamine synthase [Candidatus Latescibacterota bacterium]|nr:MAG: poly-beta-1,6 N-acetyl-D-glucosamine synthase [Candidatus Latescibacterota bacterium]